MSLKEKAVSGMLWSFTQQFGARFIGFFITIILARLLSPEEFGLIAMLYVFISIGTSLMDSGLTSSLIRTSDAGSKDYSTVFYFNIAGSIIMYALLFVAAPYIAQFYKQEMLAPVIRVYGLAFIINALGGIQNTILTKEMKFKVQTAIQIPSILGGGIVGVAMANMEYGVWSLVWMNLFNTALATIMVWFYSSWRPTLEFDTKSFKYHFNFGYKMTLSGLLETLHQNIYVIIIGKFYSAVQLGYYSRAESISALPVLNISAAINKVAYPMFASISGQNERLKIAYKKLLQQVVFWNTPILAYLCVVAEPLFRFLITEKWLPAVPYFQLLCLAGIMYPLHSYNLNILKVKGRSDLILKLEVFKKTLSIAGILCVIPFGIYGLLYFQLGFSIFGYYINSIYSGKVLDYPMREQIEDISPAVLLSGITASFCYLFDSFIEKQFETADFGRVLLAGLLYSTTYLSCSHLLKMAAISDFKQLILKR